MPCRLKLPDILKKKVKQWIDVPEIFWSCCVSDHPQASSFLELYGDLLKTE